MIVPLQATQFAHLALDIAVRTDVFGFVRRVGTPYTDTDVVATVIALLSIDWAVVRSRMPHRAPSILSQWTEPEGVQSKRSISVLQERCGVATWKCYVVDDELIRVPRCMKSMVHNPRMHEVIEQETCEPHERNHEP
jgi:hypothetical protein